MAKRTGAQDSYEQAVQEWDRLWPEYHALLYSWTPEKREGMERWCKGHSAKICVRAIRRAFAGSFCPLKGLLARSPEQWCASPPSGGSRPASSVHIEVTGIPPAKDSAKSIRSQDHPHFSRVKSLVEAMEEAMIECLPFEETNVRMVMRYQRARGRADALNIVNGVADIIQRRCHRRQQRFDTWVIEDDAQIREVHYTERQGPADRYEVTISALPERHLEVP